MTETCWQSPGNCLATRIAPPLSKAVPSPVKHYGSTSTNAAQCDYFTVDKLYLDGTTINAASGCVDNSSFASILFLIGEGDIQSGEDVFSFKKGERLLPAGSGEYTIYGCCEALITTIKGESL